MICEPDALEIIEPVLVQPAGENTFNDFPTVAQQIPKLKEENHFFLGGAALHKSIAARPNGKFKGWEKLFHQASSCKRLKKVQEIIMSKRMSFSIVLVAMAVVFTTYAHSGERIGLENTNFDGVELQSPTKETVLESVARIAQLKKDLASLGLEFTRDEQGRKLIIVNNANLQIVNGAGYTKSINGTGNVIIGYNDSTGTTYDQRTGSHNLIVGDYNNYGSYGGVVFGWSNKITMPYATITGGAKNLVEAQYGSISGGGENRVSGESASISGGKFNVASGAVASVSGGEYNTASGRCSTITAGYKNVATGHRSTVSGGYSNQSKNDGAAVCGGEENEASGGAATVAGGYKNRSIYWRATVTGGTKAVSNASNGWTVGNTQ